MHLEALTPPEIMNDFPPLAVSPLQFIAAAD
jgi:hypothetical protein